MRGKHATAGYNSLLANLVNINDYALKESENHSRQMINNLESITDGAASKHALAVKSESPGRSKI